MAMVRYFQIGFDVVIRRDISDLSLGKSPDFVLCLATLLQLPIIAGISRLVLSHVIALSRTDRRMTIANYRQVQRWAMDVTILEVRSINAGERIARV